MFDRIANLLSEPIVLVGACVGLPLAAVALVGLIVFVAVRASRPARRR